MKHRNIESVSDEAYICTGLSGNYESDFAKCSEVDSIFIRSLSNILRTRTCLQALYHVGGNVIHWIALLPDTLIATRKMGVCVAFAILVWQ